MSRGAAAVMGVIGLVVGLMIGGAGGVTWERHVLKQASAVARENGGDGVAAIGGERATAVRVYSDEGKMEQALPPACAPAVERVAVLAARVAELERAQEGATQDASGERVFDLSQDERIELAKTCSLRIDLPPIAMEAPRADAKLIAEQHMTPAETLAYDQAVAEQNQAFIKAMRALYIEMTGNAAGADELDVWAMRQEIEAKSEPEDMAAARRKIAEERAGLREPPRDLTGTSVYERYLRLMAGAGDAFEARLGQSMGAERAKALRRIDNGSRFFMGGCGEDGRKKTTK